MTDEELLEWNRQGLIPGPNEDEDTFLDRAGRCQHLKETIIAELKDHVPFVTDELKTDALLEPAFKESLRLYDIAPTWIPVFFSNHKLMPWHGGCAWIFQVDKDSPPLAFLQLRREFLSQEYLLGLYQRDELMTHELSHVGRMAFQEPQFEEILAYRSAASSFRRWLGPLLQSSYEALALVGLFLLSFTVDLVALFQTSPHVVLLAQWWKMLPFGYLAYLFVRLAWRQRCFARCRRRLVEIFADVHRADSVLYRLTDAEIRHFSRGSVQSIHEFMQQAKSLRWRLLHLAYLGGR